MQNLTTVSDSLTGDTVVYVDVAHGSSVEKEQLLLKMKRKQKEENDACSAWKLE